MESVAYFKNIEYSDMARTRVVHTRNAGYETGKYIGMRLRALMPG